MNEIKFEWNKNKAEANIKKHGISFEEAATVFLDDRSIVVDDPDHSARENRYIIFGISSNLNLLTVCHCLRDSESTIRIISARKSSKKEEIMFFEITQGRCT